MRRFLRVPIIYVLNRNKKNNIYHCSPQFYSMKEGFTGVKTVFVMFTIGDNASCNITNDPVLLMCDAT